MKIDIIGGGIGGLTTAIALQQKGFQVRVFEQTKMMKPVGAGIFLANNAMQVYEKLGLREAIEAVGNPINSMRITKPDLQSLSKFDLTFFEKKYGVRNVAIHRAALLKLLAESLGVVHVYFDKKLSSIERGNELLLKFKDGSQLTSEAIIGADGINSITRKLIFPNAIIRNAEQICWRGITDFSIPESFEYELNEAWGKGNRFGFGKVGDRQVYWYALTKSTPETLNFNRDQVATLFEDYHPIIQKMIQSTPADKIHTDELTDLKPIKKWATKDICLIGDAAHATTPNLGQGACQAIEDAYVLAACLERFPVSAAFQAFQKHRIKKTHHIVKGSWMLGKVAHIQNPVFAKIRDWILQMTPSQINKKQMESIFELGEV